MASIPNVVNGLREMFCLISVKVCGFDSSSNYNCSKSHCDERLVENLDYVSFECRRYSIFLYLLKEKCHPYGILNKAGLFYFYQYAIPTGFKNKTKD